MTAFIDRTGQKYGRLTVLRRSENTKHGHTQWECLCDCGNTKVVATPLLAAGYTASCGCLRVEVATERSTTHGKAGGRSATRSRTYQAWSSMRKRCSNPNSAYYHCYGGRGIKVCERWQKFENFLEDMGECPDDMSIERINVNADYCPENCKWATNFEQSRNTRRNVRVIYQGREMAAVDFARALGRRPSTVYYWFREGFTTEQIIEKAKG